jgi:hypothetical protein
MSEALEKARQKRQEMKAAGIKPSFTVEFTGEEAARLFAGVERTDVIEGSSAREYVKVIALRQADLDAAKPKKERKTKTAEQLQAEIAAAQARLEKMLAAGQ